MIIFYVSKKKFRLIFDLKNRTFGVQLRVICGGIVGGSVRSLVETVNIIKYILLLSIKNFLNFLKAFRIC